MNAETEILKETEKHKSWKSDSGVDKKSQKRLQGFAWPTQCNQSIPSRQEA
jgi:hypothetical protein